MRFLDWIVEYLWEIGEWFWEAYKEVDDWVWPFYFLADPLWEIQRIFGWLSWEFEAFNEWVYDTVDKLQDILSKWDIWDFFEWWFDAAEKAWNWVRDAWDNIWTTVEEWWNTTWPTVQGWIAVATQGFDELKAAWDNFWEVTWPGLLDDIAGLEAAWDNFWTVTFPSLVSFTWLGIWWDARLLDINSLIESWTLTLAPFWAGWQEIRDTVLEFFADPLKWLYDRIEDFMDRYW